MLDIEHQKPVKCPGPNEVNKNGAEKYALNKRNLSLECCSELQALFCTKFLVGGL